MSRTYKRRGFTLIELMVTVSVLSIITIAIVALIMNSLTAWSSATSKDTATSHATIALEKLSKDIRDGQQAQVVSGALVVTFPLLKTDATTGEQIYDPAGSDPITRSYYISDSNLMRRVGTSTSIFVKGVKTATFGVAGGKVTSVLTVTEQVGRRTADHELTGRVALRNFRS